MKSTIISLALLTLFVGNMLDAVVMSINYFNAFWSFLFFASMMLATAAAFAWWTWNYDVKDFSAYDEQNKSRQPEAQQLQGFSQNVALTGRTAH